MDNELFCLPKIALNVVSCGELFKRKIDASFLARRVFQIMFSWVRRGETYWPETKYHSM